MTTTTPPGSTPTNGPSGIVSDVPGFATIPKPTPDPFTGGKVTMTSSSSSTTTPPPASSSTTTDELDDDRGSSIGSDELGDRSSSLPPTLGPVSTADPESLEGIVSVAVGLAGFGAHQALSPGDDNDVWIMDDDDLASIAGPLSRIAARRIPAAAASNPDLADGIEAAVAVAGYGIKNYQRGAHLKAARAAATTQQPPPPDQ